MQQLTVHNTHEYNGVSERLNQTLLEHTHTLLHSSKLPKNLWGEAINHIVWLKNRTITCALPDGKTPYKMLYHKKTSLKNVHEWESHIWAQILDGTKLDGRSKIRRWIGFEEIINGHQIYWPDKRSVTVKCSIKFVNDEAVFLSNPIAKLIQRENDPINDKNLQHDLETRALEAKNHQDDPGDFTTNNTIDFVTNKQNQQQLNPLN
jgi:hypothetical protein